MTRSPTSPTHQRSLFRNSNEDRKKREGATLQKMNEITTEFLEQMEDNSAFFGGNQWSNINDSIARNEPVQTRQDDIMNSKNHSNGSIIVVPRFEPNEIELETTIGMGEFGVVLKVGTICLNHRLYNHQYGHPVEDHRNAEGSEEETDSRNPESEPTLPKVVLWLTSSKKKRMDHVETNRILREELAKTCLRRQSDGSTITAATAISSMTTSSTSISCHALSPIERQLSPPFSGSDVLANSLLVIKQIRKDLYPKKRIEAAKDLAREAKLLARLQQVHCFRDQSSGKRHRRNGTKNNKSNHPNLISLRGIVSDPGSPTFGLILDRLHLTLTELATSWGKRQKIILEKFEKSGSLRKHRAPSFLSMPPPPWWVPPNQLVGTLVGATQKFGDFFQNLNGNKNNISSNDEECQDGAISNVSAPKSKSGELGLSEGNPKTKSSPEALLLLGERILALWDVAEGMRHLHCHKIVYRDLKTENIGRTVKSNEKEKARHDNQHEQQQRMQIFDFGLAKECKLSDRVSESPKSSATSLEIEGDHTNENGTTDSFYANYKLTGMTGTMRIMAPEVIRCLPYGLPADVYSFGICMWEVFTGSKCNFLTAAEICDKKNTVRPQLPRIFDTEKGSVGMPKKLQKLMQKCWHEDPRKRPDFDAIGKTLRSLLAELHRQSPCLNQQRHHQQQRIESSHSSSFFLSKSVMDGRRRMVSPFRSCVNGNAGGSFWEKIPRGNRRQHQQHQHSTASGGIDASTGPDLSDPSEFWSRLDCIHSSGLLEN